MNVVFLSPHFPDNFYNFCVSLHQCGFQVLGIADCPFEQLRPELRASLTDYYQVSDMNDYEQLYRACGYFCHRYGRIDRLESHNEFWLETDARLRSDFNVFGIRRSQIQDMKLKSQMKKKYVEAGVPVAPGILARDFKESGDFIQEHGYPFVAKPDNGVGAANTFRINDGKELERLFARPDHAEFFLEKFVQGEIYSYDGLVDREGNVVFDASHVFEDGIMDVVNQDLDLFYYSLRKIPAELEEYGKRTLRIFDVRERFFHLEFFRTREGEFKALEVNMRPPGGFTLDMFNYANDISVYDGWAEILAGKPFPASYDRKYHTCYIGRKFNKDYRNYHEDILRNYGSLIVSHGHINPIFRTVMGNYGYIARSPELDPLVRLSGYVRKVKE